MKRSVKLAIAGGSIAAMTIPALAIIGVPGVPTLVFDSMSYASLVGQAATMLDEFNMVKEEMTHFSLKQQWMTTRYALENLSVQDVFGETNGMTTVLNTDPGAAVGAWGAANMPIAPTVTNYAPLQQADSAQRAELAMVETSDAVSPDCLASVGAYRSQRTKNATANNELTNVQMDSSDSTNTQVQQLNLLNAASAQAATERQSQGAMQSCMAAQMAVNNMVQRNAAAYDLNTWSQAQQERAQNPTAAANGSDTWTSFLP
jgi:hypothetical protein